MILILYKRKIPTLFVRVQVADRNRFKFSKKITRGCRLLDPRWNGLFFNYMSEGLFLLLWKSNPSANNSNLDHLAEL